MSQSLPTVDHVSVTVGYPLPSIPPSLQTLDRCDLTRRLVRKLSLNDRPTLQVEEDLLEHTVCGVACVRSQNAESGGTCPMWSDQVS